MFQISLCSVSRSRSLRTRKKRLLKHFPSSSQLPRPKCKELERKPISRNLSIDQVELTGCATGDEVDMLVLVGWKHLEGREDFHVGEVLLKYLVTWVEVLNLAGTMTNWGVWIPGRG